jgi:hypothetical protein
MTMLNAQSAGVVTVLYPRANEDDRSRPAVLCKIARFLWESRPDRNPRVSNSDQLFGGGRAIMN